MNADIPYTTKHPILLHKNHYVTTLIVQNAHKRVGLDGVRETLTEFCRVLWQNREDFKFAWNSKNKNKNKQTILHSSTLVSGGNYGSL